MKRTNTIFSLLMPAFYIALPMVTFAQPGPPGDTPVDGGLGVLIAAGTPYGVKKYRDDRKKQGGKVRSKEQGILYYERS